MLRFFFRKNFYEGWDDVPYFFLPNILTDVVVALLGVLAYFSRSSLQMWIYAFLVGCVVVNIFNLAWADCCEKFVTYKSVEVKDFFRAIPKTFIDGMLLGLTYFVLIFAFFVAFIFFFNVRFVNDVVFEIWWQPPTFVGMMAGFTSCWFILVMLMCLSWFPAIKALLHGNFRRTFKKCFFLTFDNLGTSLVILFYNFFLSLISIVLGGLVPGMAGLTFARTNAFYLILKKYDYYDEMNKNNPDGIMYRTKIPWSQLLKEDEEITGHRTWKNFLMPWKADKL